MPVFTHRKTGERVLAPVDHPEGARLATDPDWDAEDDETPAEPTPTPAYRRRRPAAAADAAVSATEPPAEGSGTNE